MDAYENMAKDEAIALSVKDGKSPPTLRLYQWDRTSVTIGRYQQVSDVNLSYCRENGIPVVRRPTGGRAILHGRDLTYSFSSRTDGPFSSSGLLETYSLLSRAFLVAFRSLGLEVQWKSRKERGSVLTGSPLCFQSVSFGEITIEGKKVMGSAQKRWDDAFLQQGTIMLEIEHQLQEQLFKGTTATGLRETMVGVFEV
ncbi:MAG: lipoate--protein ligase family protein, partial [Nitrospirae bacterium]